MYYANTSAWVTQRIFNDWLQSIDLQFKRQNRKVLLFVDNFSGHSKPIEMENIVIKYFPENMTSKAQPLDLGIIKSFKSKYKMYFFRTLSAQIRSHLEIDPNLQKVNELQIIIKNTIRKIILKELVNWMTSAWNDVNEELIENCFKRAGFDVESDVINSEETPESEELIECLDEIQNVFNEEMMNTNEIFEFEEDLICLSDDWKSDLFDEAKQCSSSQEQIILSDSDTEEEEEVIRSELKLSDVIERLDSIEDFVLKETPQMFFHYNQLKNAMFKIKTL